MILVLSLFSTITSLKYERSNPTVIGNVCTATSDNPRGFCFEDLPAGGFPFSYLYDAGGVSVMGSLDFIEDDFYLIWFIADIAFYFLLFLTIFLLIKKKIFLPSPNSV